MDPAAGPGRGSGEGSGQGDVVLDQVAQLGDRRVVEVHAVGQPHVVTEPAELAEDQRGRAEAGEAALQQVEADEA